MRVQAERDRTAPAIAPATAELLAWIAAQPRSYAEAVDVWRTGCPRHSVWEDAIADGLVVARRAAGATATSIALTERGRAALAAHAS